MSPRARWTVAAALLVAFAAAVLVAGRVPDGAEPALPGVQRLGPEPGEPVVGYQRRAAASLPGPGEPVWALVQLDPYLAADPAAALVAGTRVARVVLRVPLPMVQTALVTRGVPGQRPAAELAAALDAAAGQRAAAAARAPAGSRQAGVAAAEARALGSGCACVLAVLVRAGGDALRAVAARPEVRVVHAATPGTPADALALSPLLPEQVDVAGPVPDDGPVP